MNALRLLAAQMDLAFGKRRHGVGGTKSSTREGPGSKESLESISIKDKLVGNIIADNSRDDISDASDSTAVVEEFKGVNGNHGSVENSEPKRGNPGLSRVVFNAIFQAFVFLLPLHTNSAWYRLFSLLRSPRRVKGAVAANSSAVDESVNELIKSPRHRSKARKDRLRGFSMSSGGQLVVAPPRPLLSKKLPMKTLVLDLDETLIHSLSRGSQFSASQMVEVKLENQMATLYFVDKRPYCDHFLRTVAQWFRLVVYTASVQAYADPMIDWLERERKYFARRLYRQHCIESPAGYIKDLKKVDPDLRNVVILDNSPISYSLQEDNAIGIEGWISDPSDHSLLHLLPVLNALRYSLDVRPFLSLKQGEAAFE